MIYAVLALLLLGVLLVLPGIFTHPAKATIERLEITNMLTAVGCVSLVTAILLSVLDAL